MTDKIEHKKDEMVEAGYKIVTSYYNYGDSETIQHLAYECDKLMKQGCRTVLCNAC